MQHWKAVALLIVAGLCAFANAIAHPFVHDDIVFIVLNSNIKDLNHLGSVFFPQALTPMAGVNAYYRPILEIVYRLEFAIFNLNPTWYHLTNIVIHVGNGLLVFYLLCRLFKSESIAFLVALFFLIHPVQNEAVACIAGISNLLMATCVLGCMITYVAGAWPISIGLFLLGLLTKEQALMIVPLIVLIDCWYWRKDAFKKAWMWAIFTATALAFLVFRQLITHASLMHDLLSSKGELLLRLKAIAHVLLTDLRVITAPYDIHYYRSTDILAPTGLSWLYLAVLTGSLILMARLLKKDRDIFAFGAVWFLAALLPVLNILPLINEYSLILTADHFLYLPIIGVLMMLIVAIYNWINPKVINVVTVGLVIVCLFVMLNLNTFWKGEVSLFERTTAFEPQFGRGHYLLGRAYYAQNDFAKAMQQFQAADRIMATYEQKADNPTARAIYTQFRSDLSHDMAQTSTYLR